MGDNFCQRVAGLVKGGCCILLFSGGSLAALAACATGPRALPSIYDVISTALTTADLPAHACRTPPDNSIARGAGLLQRGFLSGGVLRVVVAWVSALRGNDIARGPGSYRGVFLSGGVFRVVVAWVSALRGNDIARGAGLRQGLSWLAVSCGLLDDGLLFGVARVSPAEPGIRPSFIRLVCCVACRSPAPRAIGFPGMCPLRVPQPPATTRRTILLQRFSFDSGPAHEQPAPADLQRHPGDKFCHPSPGHGPSSPGCTTQGPVHNRYPIIPKGSLAHGAHGAPYPRTRVTGCFSVGCAARTIGDHPGGVRRGEKFFAPTTGACVMGEDVHGAAGNLAAARSHAPAWERSPGRSGVRRGRWPPTTVPLLPSRARPAPTSTAAVVGAGHARDKKGISMTWSGILPRR